MRSKHANEATRVRVLCFEYHPSFCPPLAQMCLETPRVRLIHSITVFEHPFLEARTAVSSWDQHCPQPASTESYRT